MDEILSLRNVQGLGSPADVFTAVHSDNNHYLNSLWLWAIGPEAPSWLLRLPPLVLGTALVAVAYRVALSGGRRAAVITAVLFAFSYPLVHYASEARGYGYLVFLALLAYAFFRRWVRTGRRRSAAAYAVAASLAFLAHLGFLTVFAAFLLWSTLEIGQRREDRRSVVRGHVLAHAMPVATVAVLYLVDVRWMTASGGFARLSTLRSLAGAAGLVVGEAPGPAALVLAAAAWIAIVAGLLRLRIRSPNESVFLAAAMVLALLSGALPGYGYPRYYLTTLLFGLLLLGGAIAGALDSRRGRVAGLSLLTLIVAANLAQTLRFAAIGRGMYREAAAYMAAATGFGPTSAAGSHDMGTVLALDWYGGDLPAGAEIFYYCHSLSTPGCERVRPDSDLGDGRPAFYIISSLEDRFDPGREIEVPGLGRYRYARSFPKYGLSGIYWVVYRAWGPEP